MSYDVDIIRGSTTYSVSDGNPFWSLTLTGIGMPPIRLQKERGPQQNGSTPVGHLLDERLINLALLLKEDSEANADTARDLLAEILKPISGMPCQIRITRADGAMRQIDSYTVGTVDFPNTRQERFAGAQLVVAQFEAPDPIPYDPELQTITFDISGSLGGLQVPFEIPMEIIVDGSLNSAQSLSYDGKWDVYPIIYATGPAEDLVITNETTGDVLDFTGHTIDGGDTYTIDLRYGFKSIRDQNGVLINSALTDDSNLATWRIAARPIAPGGINTIRVEIADDATPATQVLFEFYKRYPNFG